MTGFDEALRALRAANPVPDSGRRYQDSAESRALAEAIEPHLHSPTGATMPTTRSWRPAMAFLVGLLLIVAASIPLLLTGGNGGDVADITTPTLPAEEIPAPTLPHDPAPPPAPTEEPTITPSVVGFVGLESSGGFVWAWGADEIWRYTDGAWSFYAPTPRTGVTDVAFSLDVLWATQGSAVWYFDGETWQRLSENVKALGGLLNRIEADEDGDVLWISSHDDLYRWDGTTLTNVGHPPDGIIGETFAVAADGTVWVSNYCFIGKPGPLSRYDPQTESWQTVDLPGVNTNLVNPLVSTATDGDLWVVLTGAWNVCESGVEALAHLDAETGLWAVYRTNLPDLPFAAQGDDTGIWLAPGPFGCDGFETSAIWHFDGSRWTAYLGGIDVSDMAIGPDGTVWYTTGGDRVRRLTPEDAFTPDYGLLNTEDLPERHNWNAWSGISDIEEISLSLCGGNIADHPAMTRLRQAAAQRTNVSFTMNYIYQYIYRGSVADVHSAYASVVALLTACASEPGVEESETTRLSLGEIGDERYGVTFTYIGNAHQDPPSHEDRFVERLAAIRVEGRLAIIVAYEWADATDPEFLTDDDFTTIASKAANRLEYP